MLKLLLSGGAALCILTLTGCGKPSDSFLQQCLSSSGEYSSNVPLSAMVGTAESRGTKVSWRDGTGNSKILELSQSSQISTSPNVILMEIEGISAGETKEHCGPGIAFIKTISINGEEQLGRATGAFADRFIAAAEAFFKRQQKEVEAQASVVPPTASTSPTPTSDPSTEMSPEEEAEAEGAFYAERAMKAPKQHIIVTPDTVTYYCCLTVGSIFDDFKRSGASPKITTADDGTVWLNVADPKGRWRGWTDLEFEFKLLYPENDQLVLSSIKNAGKEVAFDYGDGLRTTQVLRERFNLKPQQEHP